MVLPYVLEGCVDSLPSALNAVRGGATRLELCSNLVIGGTTPSPALLHQVLEQVTVPVRVLIRPRFGDFLYSEDEILQMEAEIRTALEAGAQGVVIGALTPDGCLDSAVLRRLLDAASGAPVTLHRAFDMCQDPFSALEEAITLGLDTILTSGQQDTCLHGLELLKELHQRAAGRIQILCGGGVNPEVIAVFLASTGIRSFHMSGKKTLSSKMHFRNPDVHMGLPGISEYEQWLADENAFLQAKRVLEAKK